MSLDNVQVDQADSQNNEVAANAVAPETVTLRTLKHGLAVVFLGHSENVPTEFHSSVIASHIAQVAGEDGPVAVAIFGDGVRDDLAVLKTVAELAEDKPVLIVIRGYSGAKTYSAVKQFLDQQFVGVRYEALMVIKANEAVDAFNTAVYEVDEGEGRIDAFKLAIMIITKSTKKPCDCKHLVSELLDSLTSH